MVKLEAIHSFNNAAGVRRQGLDEMQGHGSLLCDESGPGNGGEHFPSFPPPDSTAVAAGAELQSDGRLTLSYSPNKYSFVLIYKWLVERLMSYLFLRL
jgi:hypothetical protein